MENGKLQPQALDLEEAVLGAILIEKEALSRVITILKHDCFYKDSHQKIFKAIEELAKRNEPADILTVTNELLKNGELDVVGGPFAIVSLTNRVASSANVEFHARVVLEKFMLRELIRISAETITKAYDPEVDVFDIFGEVENNIKKTINSNTRGGFEMIEDAKNNFLNECTIALNSNKATGIECSITKLNQHTNGWQKGDLIILAARPGMGKTSAAMDFALNPALNGIPVAFFSLEMSTEQLAARVLSLISRIDVQEIVMKKLNHEKLKYLINEGKAIDGTKLFLDKSKSLSIVELSGLARRYVNENKVELIVVDYLQLMKGSSKKFGGNRENEIAEISRGLKSLALELDIPIIALSQLSRECEKRPDKRPQLSDLRESGAIEQDADIVVFIYRPEYYKIEQYDIGNGEQISTNQLLIFDFAKFRNGKLGEIMAKFIGSNAMVCNY